MKIRVTFVILYFFGWSHVVLCAPPERMPCRVRIEIQNRFKREYTKTYYFDAEDAKDCARIAREHEAAPKPAYILKRKVTHDFR